MMSTRALCAILLTTFTLACASPQSVRPALVPDEVKAEEQRQSLYVLERRTGQYARLYNIAERLTRANADLCRRAHPTLGLRFENINDYEPDLRPAARELWGLSETVSVAWVGETSPAARSGLRVRDQVLAINGRAIPVHRNASRRAFTTVRDEAEDGAVTLRVNRGGETIDIAVTPEQDCAYQVVMVDDETINASADGRTIYFHRGMLRFAQSDEEVALIVGHELAHNAMGHLDSRRQNQTMGILGGALLDVAAAAAGVNTGGAFMDAGGDIGASMFSQSFESEADYVGMYFMARAGYSIDGVEEFWRRMSAENPRGIRLAYSHPSNATRFVGLASTREEITARRTAGHALRPRMRGEAEPTALATPAVATTPSIAAAAEPAPAAAAPEAMMAIVAPTAVSIAPSAAPSVAPPPQAEQSPNSP